MTTRFASAVRERIYEYLAVAGTNLSPGNGEVVRLSWQVSGTLDDGVSASFSDADGVIEFGLLSRMGGEPINVLHASVVLDDDSARILCVSDTNGDMNFEGAVKPEASADGLFLACDYFTQVVDATVPA